MKPIALITGASSGIGKAIAEQIADHYRLIICGRRTSRLEALSKVLSHKTEILIGSFDVRDQSAVSHFIDSLPDEWQNIFVLINNAGNAHGLSFIHEGDTQDWDAMIDINVKGLLYVSRAIIPKMIKAKAGHIINLGSIAGTDVYPRGNVYNASKFAVDALTKGMRMDLNTHGIKVSEIKPGLVETEFSEVRFKGDLEKAKQAYAGYDPLQAQDIAECIAFMLSRPKHVNIGDMVVLPLAQASSTLVNKQQK
ncbi:SDR family NAD(P)-dependent oxidoreductase [Cyclobacteriaceae bacterium]|jgi:3-hydroxy acid dehydrogenase/malonic semialdehyde reductase|nr:SDR family NAD(P)-dependent oxidoreductase [Cyclobacteriaceae bacterium]MDA9906346.1 SDR family NAD(P)-dependent oxidoreductase [Cyclobacteriaceae bacterium]MDB9939075.1 SDR family NAD(P)-dependent oxidoreductase [Cyclobacteriaceae bacterium]MDC1369596.1 SDR family NAD(P)-dependent oxidoreductase [Cyclobacteriaceae bacterium]MDC6483956.1 SDR family NAD(P)-dependent oxidoreductase [Cyclobacteriaceae bacterium]